MREIAKVGSIPTRFTDLLSNPWQLRRIMRWRDIRFEKPTEADGDAVHGEVLIDCKSGKRRARNWEDVDDDSDTIAWMPISELPAFEPIPDPPDPQYRPYSAVELKLLIGKVVDGVTGYRAMITGAWGDSVYCQGQKVSAEALLRDHTWTDGGKCGVRIDK